MSSLFWLLTLAATAAAYRNGTRRAWGDNLYSRDLLQHLDPPFERVKCTDAMEKERYTEILKATCGDPKEVLVTLLVPTSLQAIPSEVWLKRCVGICSDEIECEPIKSKAIEIPIRLYDVNTDKESCAVYEQEEHEVCQCRYKEK